MANKFEIRQGDCLEQLRQIADESIDVVITSPPYNLSEKPGSYPKNGKWRTAQIQHGYNEYNDARPHADYVAWQRDILRECWRVLSPAGVIFYNHKPILRGGEARLPTELNPGLPLRQVLIWNRTSGMNFGASHFLPKTEWVLMFAKPKFKLRNRAASGIGDVWEIRPDYGNPHPAPFPVALPARALEGLPSSLETVLDPFCGSGSTGIAAIQSGRRFIGIERDESYIEMASERMAAISFPHA